ncbi:MAG: hypothetical protein ACOYXN_12215 [Acidobacteriota bacterium]
MYDPTDEKAEELFAALLSILRGAPSNLAKQSLARLFEEAALTDLLAREKKGLPADEEAWQDALAERWEEVESLRNEKAASFLHSIQMSEF